MLRALWKTGQVGTVAREVGRSAGTVKAQLQSARTKLGVGRSMEAARLLAVSDHPNGTNPEWMIAGRAAFDQLEPATDDTAPVVRDSAEWPARFIGAPLDRPRQHERQGGILGDVIGKAVMIAALLALILFSLTKLPDVMRWNLFEP